MKPTHSHLVVGLLVGALAACVAFAIIGQQVPQSATGESRTLVIGHALPVEHPVHQGLVDFASKLEELSGGSLRAEIFPSEQLGNETEMLEKVQQGSIDLTKSSAAPVGNFVPVFRVYSLPYVFRDRNHYWNVLDGEIGQELLAALSTNAEGRPSGLVGVTYYDAGSRSFYATRAIERPADLEGLKIRVMQDPVAEAAVSSLGGSAVTMPFSELYTSLQQGGVDGAENNPPSFYSSRHFEVCKHYALDHHTRIPDVLIASQQLWDSLSEVERDWVREAAAHSSRTQRELWAEETERSLELLEEAGVTIVEPDDTDFRAATEAVVERYAEGEIGAYVNRIEEVE